MLKSMEAFLGASGVGQVSLLSYRRDLERLFRAFGERAERVEKKELQDYLKIAGKELSFSSLSRHVSVLRLYYQYLLDAGRRDSHPMVGLSASQFRDKEGEILTADEFRRLLSRFDGGFRGMRDRVMLRLLLETGMRISELTGLNREDVGPRQVTCGEGMRRRTLSLSAELAEMLSCYLALASLYLEGEGSQIPLFITAKGKRLTRQGYWKNLKDHVILCGVDKTVSPQVLRRSFANMLLSEKGDREKIRLLLGNADTASLRGYQVRK